MKVQYLRSLLFDLFETLQAVRAWQRNSASFKILFLWQPESKLLSIIEKTKGLLCKISNKSNKRLMRYCTFIFPMSCSIAPVTSYLSENEAKYLQNGDVHIAQIPDFEMEYLENHWAH